MFTLVGLAIHVLFGYLVYKLVERKGYDWVVALLLALMGCLGLLIYFVMPVRKGATNGAI